MRTFSDPIPEVDRSRGIGIHRVAARDESDHAARPHNAQRLGKEVIMYAARQESLAAEGWVMHAEVPEGNVRDRTVKVILRKFSIFERDHVDAGVWIE